MAMFGQSHFLVMNKLAVELAERGHKVSVLVGEDADYAIGKPNVKVFPLSEELLKMNTNSIKSMTDSKTQTSFHQQVKDLVSFQEGYCDHFFQSPEMVEEIRTSNVVIGDATYLCSNLAANKFNLPLIQLNPTPLTTPTMMVFGIINNPAYVPQISTALSRYMGLFDRFKNLGFYLGSCAMLEWFLYPSYKLVKEKHGICPEKTIREVLSTVDLVIIPRDFILGHPQPIPPCK
ncbi:predicted protein [Nematostella vectensis]|uniref:Uncharacterized protein n=1 Tax=Nematostella vectensis TaxID=45351 RepID=A7SKE3_NEMVE|nr:predicted protein [Nematostella vectensis]|eukprot:XP_001627906.1 predicted protein [Nematostella vectensis]